LRPFVPCNIRYTHRADDVREALEDRRAAIITFGEVQYTKTFKVPLNVESFGNRTASLRRLLASVGKYGASFVTGLGDETEFQMAQAVWLDTRGEPALEKEQLRLTSRRDLESSSLDLQLSKAGLDRDLLSSTPIGCAPLYKANCGVVIEQNIHASGAPTFSRRATVRFDSAYNPWRLAAVASVADLQDAFGDLSHDLEIPELRPARALVPNDNNIESWEWRAAAPFRLAGHPAQLQLVLSYSSQRELQTAGTGERITPATASLSYSINSVGQADELPHPSSHVTLAGYALLDALHSSPWGLFEDLEDHGSGEP